MLQHILCCVNHFKQHSAIFLLCQHILCCFIKQLDLFQHIFCCLTFFYSNQHIYLLFQHILCCFNTFQTICICFSTFSAVYHSLFKSAHLSAVSAHFLLFQYFSNNIQQFFCCNIKTLFHIHSFLFQHIICCIYIYIYFTHTISAHFLLFQHIFCCNRTFLHTNLFNSVNTIAIHNYDRRQTFCETTQIIPKWNTSTHVKEIKYF